jgi:putative endonuclease
MLMLIKMRKDYHFYVYILASRSRTLYIGVTGSLLRRIHQHREGNADSFTAKYRIHRLVYFEEFAYADNAIHREKELKGWLREKKLAIINAANPAWHDLYPDLVAKLPSQGNPTPNLPQL